MEAAVLQVFCFADLTADGRYVYRRVPSEGEHVVQPARLWMSHKMSVAEAAIRADRPHAFEHGSDDRFAWALATQLAGSRLPDGRPHSFTHLVVAPTTCDPRILSYALFKTYDGSATLETFGTDLCTTLEPERQERLERQASCTTALVVARGTASSESVADTAGADLSWFVCVVMFCVCLVGGGVGGALVGLAARYVPVERVQEGREGVGVAPPGTCSCSGMGSATTRQRTSSFNGTGGRSSGR